VPAYPSGADMVKRSGVSLMLFGRGRPVGVIVGRGAVVAGRVVVTAAEGGVATGVGTGVNVGVGCTACCVQPAAAIMTSITEIRVTDNEIFILSDIQGACYTLRYFTTLETNRTSCFCKKKYALEDLLLNNNHREGRPCSHFYSSSSSSLRWSSS